MNALKAAGIYEKTAIVFGSKHGNSPINHTALVRVKFAVRTFYPLPPTLLTIKDCSAGGCCRSFSRVKPGMALVQITV